MTKRFVKMSGKDWALTSNPAEAIRFTSAKNAQKAQKKLKPHSNYVFAIERDESGATLLVAYSTK
jgi:hypothetical protein